MARNPKIDGTSLSDEIRRIQERVATLPILDRRRDDEILGYDEIGLPFGSGRSQTDFAATDVPRLA